jgi:ketosteroid isomerase-like protein
MKIMQKIRTKLRNHLSSISGSLILLAGILPLQLSADDPAQLIQQVEATERAFAATMADRDFDAFTSFLSDEAIFFSGDKPLRGKQQIGEAWKPFFQEPGAPFSWAPETVVVLDSGSLALSTGPVLDPDGKHVATFNSVWRLSADGDWRIVFDKGSDVCE